MTRLNQTSIEHARAGAVVYHRRSTALGQSPSPGVVHLGLGGFHRAHQAMVFDALIAQGDHRWGICAVGMRSDKLTRVLAQQDHLYLVRRADQTGATWHAPSSIVKTLVAATERAAVVEQIASADTRWITLTVTEKAYTEVLAQLIVDGLALRHQHQRAPLTIVSCDNLPDNGHVLRALCLAQAQQMTDPPGLRSWIEGQCRFPCSMVDGIVPAPSPEVRQAGIDDLGLDDPTALGVETFWEWVIEDTLVDPSDAQALRTVGVAFTDDVSGYEQAKLWMLNGSHTVLACAGAVLGDRFVREVMARPVLRQFIHGYMTHATGPLVGRPQWQTYRDMLLERFANPMVDHAVLQILTDTSAKIPVRWVPVGQAWLKREPRPASPSAARDGLAYLAMAVALFVRSLESRTETGQAFVFNDPLATELQAAAKDQRTDPSAVMMRLLRPTDSTPTETTSTDENSAIFGQVFGQVLGQNPAFVQACTHWLERIHALGIEAALTTFLQAPVSRP